MAPNDLKARQRFPERASDVAEAWPPGIGKDRARDCKLDGRGWEGVGRHSGEGTFGRTLADLWVVRAREQLAGRRT